MTPYLERTRRRCLAFPLICLALAASAQAQTPPTASATTSYTYDEAGNKTSQTDALGRVTAWTFDALGRVTSKTLPDGTRETSSHDGDGNLLAKTTPAGETHRWQYDLNDYQVGQVIPAGVGGNTGVPAASVASQFSPLGLLLSRQEQGPTTLDGQQLLRYDVNDRLLTAVNPIGQISYTHDALGRVLERSVAGAGTVRYTPDAAGRLLTVTAADGRQVRHSYDAAGRLYLIERDLRTQGGETPFIRTSLGWDAANRLVDIAHVRIAGTTARYLAGQQISRGADGAVTRIATIRGNGTTGTTTSFSAIATLTQDFSYDAQARLAREVRTHIGGTTTIRYAYDLVGNRTRKAVTTPSGTEETVYTYDVNDRLIEERTSLATLGTRLVTYGWDANGNLARRTEAGRTTLYRFDPLNRLIDIRVGETQSAAEAATPSVRYAYDASGNRVRKWTGEQASGYLIDLNHDYPQLAREVAGAATVDYVRGVGLVRQIRSSSGATTQDLYPLVGHLGTSIGAANADGELVEQLDSDAFGNLDQGGSLQTHLYTGEYWDADSQLLYLRARWYDPRVGRFVSADPFEGKQNDPRSLNRYAYAHSDPVHGTDPTGETTNLNEAGAVGAGAGVLGGLALPAIGTYLATAKTTHLAVASVPFMAMHGARISQYIQGSGRAGFDALQRSVFMVARGAAATQQQIQSAWTVGSGYTNTLNQMMGARATQFGMQIHKLVEGSMHLPASFTYSLANMAPTPYQVHTAISALHSSRMFATGPSMTVREFLARELALGRLTAEQVYRIEAHIWAAAMQGQQLTAQWVLMLTRSIP